MPGLNRTGPMGQGPRTGRGMGLCTGAVDPASAPYAGYGYGFGRGRGGRPWGGGRGFGWGGGRGGWGGAYYGPTPNWFAAGPPPADFLRAEADALRARLGMIEEELARMQEGQPTEGTE